MEYVAHLFDRLGLSGPSALIIFWIGILFFWFYVTVKDEETPIELWQFFSSFDEQTGKEHADINSLGMVAGILASWFTVIWIVYEKGDINPWVLGVCLTYLGGVKAFSSFLRYLAKERYGKQKEEHAERPHD